MTDTVENLELEIIRLNDEIDRLRASLNAYRDNWLPLCLERDKLREALEPFAKLRVGRFMTNGIKYEWRIDVAHIRHASDVLEGMK